jgi:hypothetical protein
MSRRYGSAILNASPGGRNRRHNRSSPENSPPPPSPQPPPVRHRMLIGYSERRAGPCPEKFKCHRQPPPTAHRREPWLSPAVVFQRFRRHRIRRSASPSRRSAVRQFRAADGFSASKLCYARVGSPASRYRRRGFGMRARLLPSTEFGDEAVSFDAHQGGLGMWAP